MTGPTTITLGQTLLLDGEPWTVAATRVEGILLRHNDTGAPQMITLGALYQLATLPESEPASAHRPEARNVDVDAELRSVDDEERERIHTLVASLQDVAAHVEHGAPTSAAITAKAAELGVAERTLWTQWQRWRDSGVWGLVDRRKVRISVPPSADPRLVEAITTQASLEAHDSTGTYSRFVRRVRTRLESEHGKDQVPLPRPRTLRRIIAYHTGNTFAHDARRQRNDANSPKRTHHHPSADRPGQIVMFDSNRLDVLAYDPETDTVSSLEVTVALDLCSRSILAWRITPVGATGTDAALMLADILTPEPMRPGWRMRAAYKAARIPWEVGIDVEKRLADMAAKPVIWPETIIVDHGNVFVGTVFLEACARLGISVQPAHLRTPTDKAAMERWFGTLNEDIVNHIAGYKGFGVHRRGAHADDTARWTFDEIDEFISEYIVSVYQNYRHDSLRPTTDPGVTLSPNEKFAIAIAAAGAFPLPTDPDLYFELLPVHWGVIGAAGMKHRNLKYDADAFDGCRRPSDHHHHGNKWPVRIDPRDRSVIYFKRPADGTWAAVPWIFADDVPAPFSDRSLTYLRRVLAARGEDPNDQQAVADILTDLQTRSDAAEMSTAKSARTLTVDRQKARQAARDRAGTSISDPHLQVVPDEPDDPDGWNIDYDNLEPFPTIG